MKSVLAIIVLVCIVLPNTNGMTLKRPMTNLQVQKYESLLKDHKWASIMLNLAELHIMAGGPLDQLVDAIEEVVADNERKTDRANKEYEARTLEHEGEVARINGEIDNANADIASTTEFLNNVLYVQKANLEQEIANLLKNIENAQQEIQTANANRVTENALWQQRVSEHNDAAAAIEEALEILSQLEGGASLLQVKKAKKTLEALTEKLAKSADASIVKILIALSAEGFADSAAIQRVRDLLTEVGQNIQRSLIQINSDEEAAVAAHTAFVALKTSEINQFQFELQEKNEQLNNTNDSIEYNEGFLAQRQVDLRNYEQDLVDENARFDEITANFNDLIAQLNAEYSACQEALSVLQSSDIAGYIGGRMSQDKIIDTAHGTGLNVEHKFDQFQ